MEEIQQISNGANKKITTIIIVVALGIIAGVVYWYYYQTPAQMPIEEGSSSVVSGNETASVPESDTSDVINQDLNSINLNDSSADFQEVDNNLGNL